MRATLAKQLSGICVYVNLDNTLSGTIYWCHQSGNPNSTRTTLDTELLNEISGALLAEQHGTPYGSDDRWHAHLYPIYQAEHAWKQQFMSTQVVQGVIQNALRSVTHE